MSRQMNHEELAKVMKRVQLERGPFVTALGVTAIKYVVPHFDNRTQQWFSIQFKTMSGREISFYCVNEFREVKESLFERVMAFLDKDDLHE